MRAVSNTSPISALAFIDRLSLLKSQFSEIWIPDAVLQELKLHPDPAAAASISTALQQKWIRSAAVSDSHLLNLLVLQIHPGEAEAIALASQIQADIILLDEQEARALAAQMGLAVTGVLGILLRAKLNGDIPLLRPEIELLRTTARFFISQSLEKKLLAAAGE